MTKPILSLHSVVAVSPQQVSTDLGSETVILGVEQGQYFGLEGVGARAWELLQQPVRVSVLCETLLAEYEVGAQELQADVLALLDELSEKGLIDVRPPESVA